MKGQGDLPAYGYTPTVYRWREAERAGMVYLVAGKRNEEAKKLLAEAGYSADKTVDLQPAV